MPKRDIVDAYDKRMVCGYDADRYHRGRRLGHDGGYRSRAKGR